VEIGNYMDFSSRVIRVSCLGVWGYYMVPTPHTSALKKNKGDDTNKQTNVRLSIYFMQENLVYVVFTGCKLALAS
jgi:hypothetical protein